MKQLSRKAFLKTAGSELFSEPLPPKVYPYKDPSNKDLPRHLQKTSTGINPYLGSWGETQMLHLLRRTLFGVKKTDLDFFKGKSMNECVASLLSLPANPPFPPLNNYGNNPNQSDAEVPFGSTWVNAAVNPNLEGARIFSLKAWWTGLLLNQDRTIREKMTLFWHNHFATETITVQDSRYSYKHHAMLRANCLGNFKELLKQVTLDPAMLTYLNGEQNTKTAPDENYGRELQELFTIGKDLPQHYTEEDVKQAAKVLTGWRNNRLGISSSFDSSKHDTGNKTFSAFYNNTVITGRTGVNAGLLELDDLLNMLLAHDETAKHLIRKIYRFFVYYVIDESVEKNVIVPLANLFRSNNYNILPVIETLLKSEHFYDTLNMGCMIKSPLDHLVGLCRQTNLIFPNNSDVQKQYGHWQVVQLSAQTFNQDLGDPPNVAGWPAYYENPQYYEVWINSDTLPKRNSIADYLLYVGYSRFGFKTVIDTITFAEQFSNPANPDQLLTDMITLLYPSDLSANTKTFIKTSFLLSGQTENYIWTDAWNLYKTNPSNTANKDAIKIRLQALLKYLFGQAEYQLC